MAFSNSCLVIVNNVLREYIDDFPKYLSQGFEKLSEILPSIIHTIRNCSNIRWADQENKIEFNDDQTNTKLHILIQPSYKELRESIKNLIEIDSKEKFIVYVGSHGAGYSSDWLLEDGVFSANSMLKVLSDSTWIENSSTELLPINILTPSNSAHWNKILSTLKVKETKQDRVRVFSFSPEIPNTTDTVQLFNEEIESFCKIIHEKYQPVLLNDDILKSTQNTGTLQLTNKNGSFYIFDEGSGQSNLMALNGFNLLIDAGYKRIPEFWNFMQRLDKIDTHILTSWNETNLYGIQSLLDFKSKISLNKDDFSNPNLSYCILPIGPDPANPKKQIDLKSPLEINMELEAQKIIEQIKTLEVPLLQMCRDTKSMTNPHQLYFKLGQGCLDAYPLWPCSIETSGDSKRYVDEWQNDSKSQSIYFDELVKENSCSFLLIWNGSKLTVDTPTDDINMTTRILISSSCHELNLLKSLEEFAKVNTSCNSFSGKIVEKKPEKKINSSDSGKSKDNKEKSNIKETPKSNDHTKTTVPKKPILPTEKSKETNKGDTKPIEKKPLDKTVKAKSADLTKSLPKKEESISTEKSKQSTLDHGKPSKPSSAKSTESKDHVKAKDKIETEKKIVKKSVVGDKSSAADVKKTKPSEHEIHPKKTLHSEKAPEVSEVKKTARKPISNDKVPEATESKKPLKKTLTEGSDNKKTSKPPLSNKPSEDSNVKKEVKKVLPSKTLDVAESKKPIHKVPNDKPSEASEVKKTKKSVVSDKSADNIDVKKPIKKTTKEASPDSKKITKSADKSAPIKKTVTGKSETESKKAVTSKPSPHPKPTKVENVTTKKEVKNKIADTTVNKKDLVSDVEKVDVVCPPSISLNTDDTLNNIDTSELLGKMEEIGPISHVEDDQLLITGERFDLQSTPLSDLITDSPEIPKTEEDVEALKTDALSIDQDLLITNEELPEDEKVALSIHEDDIEKVDEMKNMSHNIESDIDVNIQHNSEENKLIDSENLKQYGIYEDGEYDEEHVEPTESHEHDEQEDKKVDLEIKEDVDIQNEEIEHQDKHELNIEQVAIDNSHEVIQETEHHEKNEFDEKHGNEEIKEDETEFQDKELDNTEDDIELIESHEEIDNLSNTEKQTECIQEDLKTDEIKPQEKFELHHEHEDFEVEMQKDTDVVNTYHEDKIQEEPQQFETQNHFEKELDSDHDKKAEIENTPDHLEEVIQQKEIKLVETENYRETNFEASQTHAEELIDSDDHRKTDFDVEGKNVDETKYEELEIDHSEEVIPADVELVESDVHREKDLDIEQANADEVNDDVEIQEDEELADSEVHEERDVDVEEHIDEPKDEQPEMEDSEEVIAKDVKLVENAVHKEKDFDTEQDHVDEANDEEEIQEGEALVDTDVHKEREVDVEEHDDEPKDEEPEIDDSEEVIPKDIELVESAVHKEKDFDNEQDHVDEANDEEIQEDEELADSEVHEERDVDVEDDHVSEEKDKKPEIDNSEEIIPKDIELVESAVHEEKDIDTEQDHADEANDEEEIHDEELADSEVHEERDDVEDDHVSEEKDKESEIDNSEEIIPKDVELVESAVHEEKDIDSEQDHVDEANDEEEFQDEELADSEIHAEKDDDIEDHVDEENDEELEINDSEEVIPTNEELVDTDVHGVKDIDTEQEHVDDAKDKEPEIDDSEEVISKHYVDEEKDEEIQEDDDLVDSEVHRKKDVNVEEVHVDETKDEKSEIDNSEEIIQKSVELVESAVNKEKDFDIEQDHVNEANDEEIIQEDEELVDTDAHSEKNFDTEEHVDEPTEELEIDDSEEVIPKDVNLVESSVHREIDFDTEQDHVDEVNDEEIQEDEELVNAYVHGEKDVNVEEHVDEHVDEQKDEEPEIDDSEEVIPKDIKLVESAVHREKDFDTEQDHADEVNDEEEIQESEALVDTDVHGEQDFAKHVDEAKTEEPEIDDSDEVIPKSVELVESAVHREKDFDTEQDHVEEVHDEEEIQEGEELVDTDLHGEQDFAKQEHVDEENTEEPEIYDSENHEEIVDSNDYSERCIEIEQDHVKERKVETSEHANYSDEFIHDIEDHGGKHFEAEQHHTDEKTKESELEDDNSEDVEKAEDLVNTMDDRAKEYEIEQDHVEDKTKDDAFRSDLYSEEVIQESEVKVDSDKHGKNIFYDEEYNVKEGKDGHLDVIEDTDKLPETDHPDMVDFDDEQCDDVNDSDCMKDEVEHDLTQTSEAYHDKNLLGNNFDELHSDLKIDSITENFVTSDIDQDHISKNTNEDRQDIETPQDEIRNVLENNEIDLLHKDLDDLQMTSINSENNQDIERYMPDSESNDSDLSVDIVKDHTVPAIENEQTTGFQSIPTLDDIIEDASPCQPDSHDKINEIFSNAMQRNIQIDDPFADNIKDQNDLLHDSESNLNNENSTPDILRGLKHINLSEPTEIGVQQIIEDEEIIDYQITDPYFDRIQSNNSQFTSKHFNEEPTHQEDADLHDRGDSVESVSSDHPQQSTETPCDDNEYNIPCKVDHEKTVPYTNGNTHDEHFTESNLSTQWSDPLGLPMPTLITGKPSTRSSLNPKPSEKPAAPVASKLKSSNTPPAKVNGSANNGHRTTDSPKSTSSPRTSVAPRPSAPKSAPLTKTTTPKAPKKPEIVDHSKFPAFYMEIAYIPVDFDGNVNPTRVTKAFFTRVRARQYILPGLEHSPEVLDSLLTAKENWSEQDREVEVRLIPIKMTDTLKKWAGKHAQELSKLNIKIGAAVEHCSVSLGSDDSVSCVAHRIDF